MKSLKISSLLLFMVLKFNFASASQDKKTIVEISGSLSAWQMLYPSTTSYKLAKALEIIEAERKHKKSIISASSKTGLNYSGLSGAAALSNTVINPIQSSSIAGASNLNPSSGAFLYLTAFFMVDPCDTGITNNDPIPEFLSDPSYKLKWTSKDINNKSECLNGYFSSDSQSSSQFEENFIALQDSLVNELNKDIIGIAQNQNNPSYINAASFLSSYGQLQSIELDRDTGVIKSFVTTNGFEFVGKIENKTMFFVGKGISFLTDEQVILFLKF